MTVVGRASARLLAREIIDAFEEGTAPGLEHLRWRSQELDG